MTFRRRVFSLLTLLTLLAALYGVALIYDGGLGVGVGSRYAWLSAENKERAARIELRFEAETQVLVRAANRWHLERQGVFYPANQTRVADLLGALALRAPYPRRGESLPAHGRLGLLDSSARRIAVYGDPSASPLLNLLVGATDAVGRDVYLRRQGDPIIRSGLNIFSTFLGDTEVSWLDLRLFPREGRESLRAEGVQRILVRGEEKSYTLSRSGAASWVIDNSIPARTQRVDVLLGSISNLEGEDFLDWGDGPFITSSSVSLELGDGTTRTIALGPVDQAGRRAARVSGSSLTYLLAPWAVETLLRPEQYFSQ